jgi:hypothetical protein
MLPMILGLMISSIVSGQIIARTGKYRIFPTIGTLFMAGGFFWFTFATADKPVIFMMVGMLLIGLGLGQLMQTLTIASQNSVGPRDIGVATSASTFFRQIGGTLGVAILFSVLFSRIPDTIAAAFKDKGNLADLQAAASDPKVLADPKNAQILELLKHGQSGGSLGGSLDGDTSFLNGSDPRLAAPFLQGFSNATVTIYWVALFVVLIAFALSLFLPSVPLRQKSAIQEAADDRAAADVAAQSAADQMGALIEPGTGSLEVIDDEIEASDPPSKAPRKR